MYIFEQSEQFILYTILLYVSFGILSFNLHNYFLKVLFDLLAHFNEKGFNNLLTFSDAPLIFGVGIYLERPGAGSVVFERCNVFCWKHGG